MASSGTRVLEQLGSAAAGTTFHLEVNTLAGRCLAAIPEAQGSWQLSDVLGRLPEVPPGQRYQLLKGEAVLAPGTAIAEWAQPVDGKACVTAVVAAVPTGEEQGQLDMALMEAAGELDIDRVRELLILGADAAFRSRWPTMMTALHRAVDARKPGAGKDAEDEEEGRLQAVLGALLAARADVDAVQDRVKKGGSFSTCALRSAVQYGSLNAVLVLLGARANVNAVSKELRAPRGYVDEDNELTALDVATQAGNFPLVALLLERGADVNAVSQFCEREKTTDPRVYIRPARVRRTALHTAVAGGHQALVALLVQAGADTSIAQSRNGEETSVEELCAGDPGMLDALKADWTPVLLSWRAAAVGLRWRRPSPP